jgi:hypothetical protein
MAEFRTPEVIGTVLNAVGVVGTIGTLSSQGNIAVASAVGTIQSLANMAVASAVGTVQSLANLAVASLVGSIASGVVSATIIGGNVPDVGTIGTILSQSNLTLGSAIGTVQSLANMAVASAVGTLQSQSNIAVASLVGSVGSPIAVGGGTLGTLQSQSNIAIASLVGAESVYTQATIIIPPGSVSFGTRLPMGTLQGLVVDVVFGTMVPTTASVQVVLAGIDPASGIVTSTLVNTPWYSGTIGYGTRLVPQGPLGGSVFATVNVQAGTIAQMYVTAQLSAFPNITVAGQPNMVVAGGTLADVGTIGTVLAAVAVQQAFPPVGVVATISATISGVSGTLFGILANYPLNNIGTIGATLLVFGFPGTASSARIPFEMILLPGQFQHFQFDRGLAYTGSLVASIQGTLNALFLT